MLISIVIPFHNEEQNLQMLLPALMDAITGIEADFEVFLVDDVSTDNSRDVAENFCNDKPAWQMLALPARGGQTGCYALAFEKAKGDYIIRMDADLQDDPRDLTAFFAKFENGADLVMGLRECKKQRRLLRISAILYDLLILILFNTPLHSNSGSYVAFKADLVKNIAWRKNDHRYLPLIAIRRGAKEVKEVIVRHNFRVSGVSKYSPLLKVITGIPEVLRFIVRLHAGGYDTPP